MSFQNRSEFINAQASEKVVLAHVHGRKRLQTWTVYVGNIWVKTVDYFTTAMAVGTSDLSDVGSKASVTAGTFAYEPSEGNVYVHLSDSSDPNDSEMIATHRFFYANAPITASYDLTDTGEHVSYQGRITQSPGYKQKIAVEQDLVSTVGSGNLNIENNDGEFDDIFDVIVFENQIVEIYSWNRFIPFSESKIMFRGRITNKTYTTQGVSFTIKDKIFDLQQTIPQSTFSSDDNVPDSAIGNTKRWIYGRVDGLKLQSIDAISSGIALTGTVEVIANDTTMTGTGTSFLSELSPDDKIFVDTLELTVESVESDTSLTLTDEPDYGFTGQSATYVPEIPVNTANRDFFIAGHACARLSKTLVEIKQLNRIELNNTDGILAGDFLEFATAERIEVKNLAPGNIVVLRKAITTSPAVSSSVIRQPVQEIFIESEKVSDDDYTITNTSSETTVTLNSDVEFNIADTTNLNISLTFTNGSRNVTYAGTEDLRSILKPRDWIRPTDISFTTFYEILQVNASSLDLRVSFADPNHTGTIEGKLPQYVGDDTIVSGNVLGRTEDNTPEGTWISTSSQVVKDALSTIDITDLNTASFDEVESTVRHTISLTVPSSPGSAVTSVKDIVDKVNRSVFCALTTDNDLKLKYIFISSTVDQNIETISDNEVVKWAVKSTNGKSFRNSVIKYRFRDIDRYLLEASNLVQTHTSDFVEKYVGTNKTVEREYFLYDDNSARTMSHRDVYFNSLSRSDITVESDLRLSEFEIGDQVIIDFQRMYKRWGDSSTNKKVALIVGRQFDGEKVILNLSDLGNLYNLSAIITDNAAADFTSAPVEEKLINGYITAGDGLVNSDDITNNTNNIS